MILYDLIRTADFKQVLKALHTNYDSTDKVDDEGFLYVWLSLFKLEPVPMENIKRLEIVQVTDDKHSTDDHGNIIPWVDVYGLSEDGIKYSIDLSNWNEWLSLEISNVQNFDKNNFLSHVLWEMTFFGFDQTNIRQFREDLKKQIDEIDLMHQGKIPNTLKSFVSVDEMFKNV